MQDSAPPPQWSKNNTGEYISIPAAVLYLAGGAAGFILCLVLTGGTDGTLGWIAVAQACVVFVFWPRLCRNLSQTAAPAVLLFLSVPLYVAGVRLGGAGVAETAMSLLFLYMLFLYVSLFFRLEESMGIPPGAWYLPVSTLLVAGPIVVYYILAEFLQRPMIWIAGISPMVALKGGGAHLRVGCAAWAGVLVLMIIIGFSSAETKGAE